MTGASGGDLHSRILLLRTRLGSAQLGESLCGSAEHIKFRDGSAAGEEGRRTAGEVRITAAGSWLELFAGGESEGIRNEG